MWSQQFQWPVDGIEMTFVVLSESDKTCQLGDGYQHAYDPNAYQDLVDFNLTVPAEVNGYSVTKIASQAFVHCRNLKSITISEGIREIDGAVFYFCWDLVSVTIPASVNKLGNYGSFYIQECPKLNSIVVAEGNTIYDSRNNCNAIIESATNTLLCGCKSTVIPDGITAINDLAFNMIDDLTAIHIPSSVTSIAPRGFYGCRNVESITVDSNNTYFDSRNNCNAIINTADNTLIVGCKNTIIPETVVRLGEYSFYNNSITSVTLPESVTQIDNYAFDESDFFNNQPEGVFYVGNHACGYKGNATGAVIIKEGTKYISSNAFSSCYEMSSVSLPDGLKSIGSYAFGGTNLSSIVIPESVEEIGFRAFSDCSNLSEITLPDKYVHQYNSFDRTAWYNNQEDGVLYLGNYVYGYKGLMPENCSITLKDGIKYIAYQTFYNMGNLKSISIPKSVKIIEDMVFYRCNNLETIDFREDGLLETVGSYAFSGCRSLVSAQLPHSIKTIDFGAFQSCEKLSLFIIPESTESIGRFAFSYCKNLTSITIPCGVNFIGEAAFEGCSGLTSIAVEDGNSQYDSRNNCNAIIKTADNVLIAGCKNTIIPNNVTAIGRGAFGGCSGLTSVTIPNSVTAIGTDAFESCSGLTSITIPNSVTTIGDYAFAYCNGLTSVTSLIKKPFAINENVFQIINYDSYMIEFTTAALYVPSGTEGIYGNTDGWKKFMSINKVPGSIVSLGKEMTTYANSNALDFTTPVSGLKAYVVSGVTDGKAVLTEVTGKVPAGTGLILKGTAGETYEIPYCTGDVSAITNKLVGVTVDTAIGGNDVDYILSNGKFVKASAGTLAAGKAYLKLDAALARGTIDIVGDATGIDALQNNKEENIKNDEVYNLNGQRVSKPAKGLYVVGGKKVMVK